MQIAILALRAEAKQLRAQAETIKAGVYVYPERAARTAHYLTMAANNLDTASAEMSMLQRTGDQ